MSLHLPIRRKALKSLLEMCVCFVMFDFCFQQKLLEKKQNQKLLYILASPWLL